MEKHFKNCVVFGMFLCLPMLFVSCGSEENDKNKEMIEQKDVDIVSSNIEKSWIVTHFQFTDECNSTNRMKYQLSSIHLDLNSGKYKAIDQYSLVEDSGSWSMKGNAVELISDKGESVLRFRINKLSGREMEADVVGHRDLIGIELIAKR
ncbi:MAG: hypothetical protein LBI72_07505 [Flavobacteriaceae bacterium]|nr:hypothetical protein [Flavobacteriaceae bacterium]